MHTTTLAQANVEAKLRAQAVRTATAQIKNRARAYAKSPMLLEHLCPGLSASRPEIIVAFAKHLVQKERNSARRWFGLGGEVPLLNAKAALLYGRARCRASKRP